MNAYIHYMDSIKNSVITELLRQHSEWIIERNNFTIYREIIPIFDNYNFNTKMLLRKRINTSVILKQTYAGRESKQYFSDFNIIETFIYLYDTFTYEGDIIYSSLCDLIEDKGANVQFVIDSQKFLFKGIDYLPHDKNFLTFADYEISINEFICLLNLVIEKERYSLGSEKGKGTILKYLLFLLLCSKRSTDDKKEKMIKILKDKDIFTGNTLVRYKSKINATGDQKLYFKTELFIGIL